jgi:chromosomal replication initiator protein
MHDWQKFLDKLKLEMGEGVVNEWVYSLKIIKFDAFNIYLEAKDAFQSAWVEEHLLPRAKKQFLNNKGFPIKIHLKLKEDNSFFKKPFAQGKIAPSHLEFKPDELDQHHSFSSFYIDKSNDLCYKFLYNLSCGEKIDEKFKIPFASFNPILIYGPSGCGKTHLLTAAAKSFIKNGKHAFYVRSQTFTSHVVNAIRLSSLIEFRNTYRKVNILIIDDIHLIAGKSATQEEFFHTFNALHSQGSQIIISSNLPPCQLKDIEQRLISRFEWGLSLPLNKTETEGLKLILDTKEKAYSMTIDQNAKDFLVDTFPSPKEIEQAIQAIILRSKSSSRSETLTVEMAKNYLSDLISEQKKNKLTPTLIVDTTAKHFGLFSNDILGKSQTRECCLPRQIAMFFCRDKLNMAYKKIGDLFGGRDHSTVMTSVKSIEKQKLEKTKETYFTLLEIEKKMSSYRQ